MPPWCLSQAEFAWDAAWNSASFQEMEVDQVAAYLKFLCANAKEDRSRIALIYYLAANNLMDATAYQRSFADKIALTPVEPDAMDTGPDLAYYVGHPVSPPGDRGAA